MESMTETPRLKRKKQSFMVHSLSKMIQTIPASFPKAKKKESAFCSDSMMIQAMLRSILQIFLFS